jgi:shikimate kinase/3-dehydroquinate synthase
VPPGEATKCFAVAQAAVETVLSAGADRRTAVVALGGGVVGDLAGFVAAHRDPRPALRAGADDAAGPGGFSSVGGKTGINLSLGKNLVGAFHQPRIVLADTATLATLPPRELRAGWAEVAKHGLISGRRLLAVVRGGRAARGGGRRRWRWPMPCWRAAA